MCFLDSAACRLCYSAHWRWKRDVPMHPLDGSKSEIRPSSSDCGCVLAPAWRTGRRPLPEPTRRAAPRTRRAGRSVATALLLKWRALRGRWLSFSRRRSMQRAAILTAALADRGTCDSRRFCCPRHGHPDVHHGCRQVIRRDLRPIPSAMPAASPPRRSPSRASSLAIGSWSSPPAGVTTPGC